MDPLSLLSSPLAGGNLTTGGPKVGRLSTSVNLGDNIVFGEGDPNSLKALAPYAVAAVALIILLRR